MPSLIDMINFDSHLNSKSLIYRTRIKDISITFNELKRESESLSKWLGGITGLNSYVGVILENVYLFPTVILGIMGGKKAFFYVDGTWKIDDILETFKLLNIQWFVMENDVLSKYDSIKELFSKFGRRKNQIYVHNHKLELWELTGCCFVEDSDVKPTNVEMAYAIKTSGTTGESKIVQVPHDCIVPNILHLRDILEITSNDIILQATRFTFDPSILEVFLALSSGATLFFINTAMKSSPAKLLNCIVSSGITFFQTTPSYLTQVSVSEIQNDLLGPKSKLKTLVLGGEPCPPLHVLREWKINNTYCNIYNIYGITEVSCWASIHKVDFNRACECSVELASGQTTYCSCAIPLGTPLEDTLLSVRSGDNTPLSDGEGEMFIGGTKRFCLINKEKEDSLSFPVFRATGDIVKIEKSSGHVYYVGRKIRLVKRMGHRVCLPQIEHVTMSLTGVCQCYCMWDGGTNKLGLFIKGPVNTDKIRKQLIQALPPASIPDIILQLDVWPLTNHGKVNEQDLKKMISEEVIKSYDDDICNVLGVFISLCCKYLGVEEVCLDDTFAQKGGNSFVALQLVSSLENIYKIKMFNELIPKLVGGSSLKECFECLNLCIVRTHNKICNENESEPLLNDNSCSSVLECSNDSSKVNLCNLSTNKRKHISSSHSRKQNQEWKIVESDPVDLNSSSFVYSNILEEDQSPPDQDKKKDKLHYFCCRGRVSICDDFKQHFVIESTPVLKDPLKIEQVWAFNMEKCVDASPVIAKYMSGRGLVAVGSHSHKLAILDCETGELISSCVLPDRIESSLCVTPCEMFGIVGCYDGCLYCVELSSGTVKWKYVTLDMIKSSPALCCGCSAVVVGSYDYHVYCIDIKEGCKVWSMKLSDSGIFSSPAVSNVTRLVYVASLNGTCSALKEDTGDVVWSHQVCSPVFSSPALFQNDECVLFAEVCGTVHCYSSVEGTELWTFKSGGNIFSSLICPVIRNGSVFYVLFGCHDKCLYCLQYESESQQCVLKWKSELDSAVFSTPAVIMRKYLEGVSVGKASNVGNDNTLSLCCVVSTSGTIYLLNLIHGSVECTFNLMGQVFSSPAVYDKYICVGCRDNNVYLLKY